jgi:hypothetical protein
LKSIGFIGFADKKCESPIKTNINIGPDVRLKKNAMFKFFPEIRTRSA